MSMYAQLLVAALAERSAGDEDGAGVSWIELLGLRGELQASLAQASAGGWDPISVAAQVAYDAALITFAQRAGITCDTSDFDQPQRGRAAIEESLGSLGRTFDS